MRSIWITRHGGPEVLEVREEADPQPRAGEVRIRVKAAGLNFADIMARLGLYPDAPKPPCVVGYEAAGLVDALGPGVTAPAVGTRVLALTRFRGQSDVVCAPAAQVVPMPEDMSFEQAAALPVNAITAWHAIFKVGNVRPRESVLVHMAAGGVGIVALQLLRTIPGVTLFGTASAAKHEVLRAEGCHHPIDYRTTDWAAEVSRLTNGRGVDVILDPLGSWDTRKGYKLLRPAGRLVCYGVANLATGEKRNVVKSTAALAGTPLFTPIGLMNDNRCVAGINVGHLWGEQELLREEMEALLGHWGKGELRPRIDSVIPFAEAARAHRRIQSRQNVGKVVLVP
jgi:NADPH:quinone reductase-like Zn-dependent oxidoreductase